MAANKRQQINQFQDANKMFYEIEIIDDVQQMIIDPIEIPEREITEDFGI